MAIGNDRSNESPVFGNLWASDDLGKTWKWLEPSLLNEKGDDYSSLPRGVPIGKVIASPEGTLISIDRQRFNIMRSTNGGKSWKEVYKFLPQTEIVHGAQGLRDIAFCSSG